MVITLARVLYGGSAIIFLIAAFAGTIGSLSLLPLGLALFAAGKAVE